MLELSVRLGLADDSEINLQFNETVEMCNKTTVVTGAATCLKKMQKQIVDLNEQIVKSDSKMAKVTEKARMMVVIVLVAVALVIVFSVLLGCCIITTIDRSKAPINKKITRSIDSPSSKVCEGEVNFDRATK